MSKEIAAKELCTLHPSLITLYYYYMDTIFVIFGLFLAMAGIVGLVVPLIPDVPLIASGLFLVLLGRNVVSAAVIVPLVVLTALALVADWLLVIYGS